MKGIKTEDRDEDGDSEMGDVKEQLEAKRNSTEVENEDTDDSEAKRRKILAETRELDADSDADGGSDAGDDADDDDSEDESEDDDDEEVLLRELEKIKKERADQREREEREKAAAEEAKREVDIARGNPLLNSGAFSVKRRWDDDVIFKNQARGTDERGKKKEFVNDLLRSDFHKKFMVSHYLRLHVLVFFLCIILIVFRVNMYDKSLGG